MFNEFYVSWVRVDPSRCMRRLRAIAIYIQSWEIGSVHRPEEGPEIIRELQPENILVFCDFVVRQTRIPARAGLELKPINMGIDRSLMPGRFRSTLEFSQKIAIQHWSIPVPTGRLTDYCRKIPIALIDEVLPFASTVFGFR